MSREDSGLSPRSLKAATTVNFENKYKNIDFHRTFFGCFYVLLYEMPNLILFVLSLPRSSSSDDGSSLQAARWWVREYVGLSPLKVRKPN
jgi:hypothetical protein